MVVVARESELRADAAVWGTGGWISPKEREALDWLTLCRLLGWSVSVVRPEELARRLQSADPQWLIVACDPDRLGEDAVDAMEARLSAEPLLVVTPAASAAAPLARLAGTQRGPAPVRGRSLCWIGEGMPRTWSCRNPLEAGGLDLAPGTEVWATLEGGAIAAGRTSGCGRVLALGLHPSRARDTDGAATSLLAHALVFGSPLPVAWLDFEGVLVLRMDDPGGSQNVHYRSWSYPKLGKREWAEIRSELRRRAGRMSLGYVAGWVDDGDAGRGTLAVGGRDVERVAGHVHPSPLVRYSDRDGHAAGTVHDYEAEFSGIQALRAEALDDVELHGYTHGHPDRAAWARAPDRYEATSWYRELGHAAAAALAAAPANEHPLALGIAALERHFGTRPTTLICPGDEWTDKVLERALALGLRLVASYYLALRDGDRFCWSTHVCAPYLDEPDACWFASGLPVVGYLHDYEPSVHGVAWLRRWLDAWADAGARRLVDFRELAGAVGRHLSLRGPPGDLRLVVADDDAPALVRPLAVRVRVAEGPLPSRVRALVDGDSQSLGVERLAGDVGRVLVQPTMSRASAGG